MDNREAPAERPDQKSPEAKKTQVSAEDSKKALSKITKTPAKTRDQTAPTDEPGKSSDEESSSEGDANDLVNAVKANEKINSVRAEKKPKKAYRTLTSEIDHGKVGFSFFAMENYLESNLKGGMFYLGFALYAMGGVALLLLPPLLVLRLKNIPIPSILTAVNKQPEITIAQENFKLAVFLSCMFVTYLVIREVLNQIVYIVVLLFKIMNRKISKDTKIFLFIVNDLRHLLTLLLFFLCSIIECNIVLEDYSLFQKSVVGFEKIPAYSLCLVILLTLFIMEKTFLKITVAYFGNNIFAKRIGDVNLKLCIIRRLFLYTEAVLQNDFSAISDEIASGIEITDSFLLSHEDFKIASVQNCEEIVGTIYDRLGITDLEVQHIQNSFGMQWEDIWSYLVNNTGDKGGHEPTAAISYPELCAFAKSGYTEKIDLKRTLYDRDKLLGKLDRILGAVALALTMIVSTPVIGFDPIKYMAGIIPLIMSSGWLFSDLIKEVCRNFIFLLHEHPFDVGDKVILKNHELTVLRIELMYSTFTSKGGTVCYIQNSRMIGEEIFNIRRSDIQTEIVKVLVKETLSIDGVNSVKLKILDILNHKNPDGKALITIQDYEIQADHTIIFFKIQYLSNFQDPEPKLTRRYKPIQIILQAIKDNNLTYMEQSVAGTV